MAQLELVQPAPLFETENAAPSIEHLVISQLTDAGVRVLELGCGNGALLAMLARENNARCSGLDANPALVRTCVAKGLSVAQGEIARDIATFPSATFDVVVLPRTLLSLPDPRAILKHAGRIGAQVIVTAENAAHWRARARLVLKGRVAPTEGRACSVRDMAELAQAARLSIVTAVPISNGRAGAPFAKTLWRANWFAERVVFLLAP